MNKKQEASYFKERMKLEGKHFVMITQWLTIKDNPKPSFLDLGCGIGHLGYVINYLKLEYKGIDISNYAIENTPYKMLSIQQGDITKKINFSKKYDIVLVVDILEHLEYKDLNICLKHISTYGNKYIFSIPYILLNIINTDLHDDETHIIKETKQWWLEKLQKYFTIKDTPKDWIYSSQLLIGEPIKNVKNCK